MDFLPSSQRMHRIGYTLSAILLAIIGFIGFWANFIVLFVIVKDSRILWTPINVILVNLTIQDLLVAILGNPLAFMSALDIGWYWDSATCLWYAWLMSTLGLGSIGSLTVMAVERWILISRPMKAFSIKTAAFSAGVVWIYALSMSLPPLFGWGKYGPEAANISCSVSWEIHDPSSNNQSYITFLFIFGLVIPVIIITASYSAIIYSLKQVRKRIGPRGKRELKILKMVAIMIIAFLIAWTPYSILALAVQFFNYHPSVALSVLPSLFAKTSICYNPIIYAGLNDQFLKSLKKIFGIKTDEREVKDITSNKTANVVSTKL
ncbi:hypothetical protein PV326_002788 [Microctonus aethiopoides]|nr:hypothetical protein PV326_002788 [Microctonus aethiopoides]